jgi:chromosomal replication initiation ATPase DnaA
VAANSLVQNLVREVERLEHIPANHIFSKSRRRELAEARWAIMLVAQSRGCSCPSIAKSLNRDDHTTVIHGLRRAADLRSRDPGFAALVGCLERAA